MKACSKKNISILRRKEREKEIKQIGSNPYVSGVTEMHKMRALNSLIEDLEDSITKSSRSTNRLSCVLVIATVILAIVGSIGLYYTITSQGIGNIPQISEQLEK